MVPSQRENVSALLRLPDEKLFAFGPADRGELIGKLVRTGFSGLALAGPQRVPLDARDELPLLCARQGTELRDWSLDFDGEALLVAMDLETGEVRVLPLQRRDTTARTTPGREPAGEPPADSADNLITDVVRIEARKRLVLDWLPGRLVFQVLWGDWLSNPVAVELEPGSSASAFPHRAGLTPEQAGEVAGALEQAAEQGAPLPALTPSELQIAALELELPEHWKTGAPPIEVSGQVAVPLGDGQVVAADPASAPGVEPEQDGPAAVVRAAFVLVQEGRPGARIVPLTYCVPEGTPVAAGSLAAFRFRFDLARMSGAPLEPGTYDAYLFAGGLSSGPHPLEVAAPK